MMKNNNIIISVFSIISLDVEDIRFLIGLEKNMHIADFLLLLAEYPVKTENVVDVNN